VSCIYKQTVHTYVVEQDMRWVLQRKKYAVQLKAGKYLQIWGDDLASPMVLR
jgi:hypothetical protein